MEFKEFLNEVFVHKLDVGNPKKVIIFKSNVWIYDENEAFDRKDGIEFIQNMLKTIIKDYYNLSKQEKKLNIKKIGIPFTLSDYSLPYPNMGNILKSDLEALRDRIGDIIEGYWDKKNRTLWIENERISPVGAISLKKAVEKLKIRSVKYHNDIYYDKNKSYESETVTFGKSKLLGDIPNNLYHGTASEYLYNILTLGLIPGRVKSNWEHKDISHPNILFFSDSFDKAKFHAAHVGNNTLSMPIIIEIKIPDKNLIIPDYDAETEAAYKFGTYNYINNKFAPERSFSIDPFKVSKHTGIYGYKGRIPPNYITGAWIRKDDKWKKINIKNFIKEFNDYGEEAFYFL